MRARLKREIEGLTVGTIYVLDVHGGHCNDIVWSAGIGDEYELACEIDNTFDQFLETWEILQDVSETTLEHIGTIVEKVYYLGVKSGRGDALWPEEESYIDDELFLPAIRVVLEGKEN